MASRNGRKVRWREAGTGRHRTTTLATEQRAREFLDDRVREGQLVRDGYVSAKQIEVATGRGGLIAESVIGYNADRCRVPRLIHCGALTLSRPYP